MVDFVEQANNSARTIEGLLVEFVPQVFKRYFQIQSHSIYNTSAKSWIFNTQLLYTENVNKSQLYATNQHISISIQIKVEG